jgi:DNA-binding Lrp family transcriptional regulator
MLCVRSSKYEPGVMMAGDTDFLLKVVAHNWDDYQKFLTSQLTATPGVANVKSMLCVRSSKYEPGVPVDDEEGKAV